MGKPSPEEITLEFVERINARDPDGLAELMTDDHTFIDSGGDVERGRDVMRKGFAEYFSSFPNYRINVSKVCTSGDAVAIVGKSTGSHVPAELEPKETVLWIARIRDGLVAEWRIYTDLEQVKKTLDPNTG